MVSRKIFLFLEFFSLVLHFFFLFLFLFLFFFFFFFFFSYLTAFIFSIDQKAIISSSLLNAQPEISVLKFIKVFVGSRVAPTLIPFALGPLYKFTTPADGRG